VYIHEAIKARTADQPCIVREKWKSEYGCHAGKGTKIFPTSTPDFCLIFTGYSKTPCRGWEPSAEDLLADDWITTN